MTIQYLSPIFTTIIAIFVLHEAVRRFQWLFYAIAFSGVLLIEQFDPRISPFYLAIGIISAFCSGMAYNLVRSMKGKEHPLTVVLHFQLVGVVVGLISLFFNFRLPTGWDWFYIVLIGIFSQLGQMFLTNFRSQRQPAPARPLVAVDRRLRSADRALRPHRRHHACRVRGAELDRLCATRRNAGGDRALLLSVRRHRLRSVRHVAAARRRPDVVRRVDAGHDARCDGARRSRPLCRHGGGHGASGRADRALRRRDALGRDRAFHFGNRAHRLQDRRRHRDRGEPAAAAAGNPGWRAQLRQLRWRTLPPTRAPPTCPH